MYKKETLINIMKPIVLSVRKELAMDYNINSNYYKDYTGLCDKAFTLFEEKIKEYNKANRTSIEVLHFHGEQRHSPRIDPKCWPYQHTWMGVMYDGIVLYIDPTSSQFKDLYNDIPDYYISPVKPRWFYSDRENPLWNGFTRVLNNKIRIKRKGEEDDITDGIIEFCQYEIWGGICKIYRRLIKRK
jgi:hypothetical protein